MSDGENEQNTENDKPKEKDDLVAEEADEKVKEESIADSVDGSSREQKSSTKIEKGKKKNDTNPEKEEDLTKQEKEESDDSESDEEELPPGLLELPLEVEGKREKKKVERLSAAILQSPQEKKKVEIEQGSGEKLGDIPFVEHQLNTMKAVDLKPLHRVLFHRAGSNNEIKKNIKQFSGFTHGTDSKEHEKRVASLNKMVIAELKTICSVLGLERSGTKGNLVDRVIEFLMKPKDKGLRVKSKTKKRSRSSGGKTKETKKKAKENTAKKKKVDKGDDVSSRDVSDDEEEEEHGEEAEEMESGEDEESEDEAPKKKKAKVENKKKVTKKSVKENGKKEKTTPKKVAKKPTEKKKPAAESMDSLSEDSEDEPVVKKSKSPPSNDELKDLVKKILDGADLETVTMKTVVKQVYDKYPSFDLSNRREFIKDTVREIIS